MRHRLYVTDRHCYYFTSSSISSHPFFRIRPFISITSFLMTSPRSLGLIPYLTFIASQSSKSHQPTVATVNQSTVNPRKFAQSILSFRSLALFVCLVVSYSSRTRIHSRSR